MDELTHNDLRSPKNAAIYAEHFDKLGLAAVLPFKKRRGDIHCWRSIGITHLRALSTDCVRAGVHESRDRQSVGGACVQFLL